jgi:hypothetical protein
MKIAAVTFRPFEKNTLRGFASLALGSSGLFIHDCCLHCKNNRWWIAFPARGYADKDGAQRWQQLIEFGDPASKARFQEQAIAALRARYPDIFEVTAA